MMRRRSLGGCDNMNTWRVTAMHVSSVKKERLPVSKVGHAQGLHQKMERKKNQHVTEKELIQVNAVDSIVGLVTESGEKRIQKQKSPMHQNRNVQVQDWDVEIARSLFVKLVGKIMNTKLIEKVLDWKLLIYDDGQ